MLTPDQIQKLTITSSVAKEAHAQTEKRLMDVLDVKKSTEQKVSMLFTSYVTIALALFGIGGTIFKEQGFHLNAKVWPFFIAGLIFVVGTFLFLAALKDDEYGFLGSGPDMWLRKGTIDGGDKALDAMFAYLTYYHATRIQVSSESNRKKIRAMRYGMFIGIVATISFAVAFLATA